MRQAASVSNSDDREPPMTRQCRRTPVSNAVSSDIEPSNVVPFVRVTEETSLTNRPPIIVQGEDPLMLRALARLLGKAGYRVLTRENGAARSMNGEIDATRPVLIVFDVPDDWQQSAGEVSTFAGDEGVAPRVLWISSAADVAEGDSTHLIKPFTGGQLLARVETLLKEG
ncbi:MAG TPA: hypothetical protein VMW65_06700 [Chloroflexota bacterium]|nr:hypothetical protein [Chloroflexota bacterium]